MRENYEYDMFENYSEVVMLLVKVRQQNLTEEEEEKVRSWREESPENEVLYAKVMSVEFMKMKMAQRACTDSERAYATCSETSAGTKVLLSLFSGCLRVFVVRGMVLL